MTSQVHRRGRKRRWQEPEQWIPNLSHHGALQRHTASRSVPRWLHRIAASLKVQFPSDEAIPKRGWNMFIILKDPGVSILYSRRLSSYLCKCQGAWEKVPLHEAST